jgi:hypothetical protein
MTFTFGVGYDDGDKSADGPRSQYFEVIVWSKYVVLDFVTGEVES